MNLMQEYLLSVLVQPNNNKKSLTLTELYLHNDAEQQGYILHGQITELGFNYIKENDDGYFV